MAPVSRYFISFLMYPVLLLLTQAIDDVNYNNDFNYNSLPIACFCFYY